MQHPVDDHRAIFHLEVEPVILRPEPVEHRPVAFDPAETLATQIFQVLLADLEFLEQLELLERLQLRELRRADFIENDLEHRVTLRSGKGVCQSEVSQAELIQPGKRGPRIPDRLNGTFGLGSAMNLTQILDELPAFTLAERQLLVRRAIELDEQEISPEDEALVVTRLAAHRRDPSTAVSLEAITTSLRSRLRK